jgi:hypothetical protein
MGLFGKKTQAPEENPPVEAPQPPGGTIDHYVGYSVIVKHSRTPGPLHEVYVLEKAPNSPSIHVKFATKKFPVWDTIESFEVVDVIGTEERDFYNSIRIAAVQKREES